MAMFVARTVANIAPVPGRPAHGANSPTARATRLTPTRPPMHTDQERRPPHPLRFPQPKRRFFRHGSTMPSEIQRIGAGTPDALPEPDFETSARKGRP